MKKFRTRRKTREVFFRIVSRLTCDRYQSAGGNGTVHRSAWELSAHPAQHPHTNGGHGAEGEVTPTLRETPSRAGVSRGRQLPARVGRAFYPHRHRFQSRRAAAGPSDSRGHSRLPRAALGARLWPAAIPAPTQRKSPRPRGDAPPRLARLGWPGPRCPWPWPGGGRRRRRGAARAARRGRLHCLFKGAPSGVALSSAKAPLILIVLVS